MIKPDPKYKMIADLLHSLIRSANDAMWCCLTLLTLPVEQSEQQQANLENALRSAKDLLQSALNRFASPAPRESTGREALGIGGTDYPPSDEKLAAFVRGDAELNYTETISALHELHLRRQQDQEHPAAAAARRVYPG